MIPEARSTAAFTKPGAPPPGFADASPGFETAELRTRYLQVNGCVSLFFRGMTRGLEAFADAGLLEFVEVLFWVKVCIDQIDRLHWATSTPLQYPLLPPDNPLRCVP
jgi:hypothetical protein